MRTVYPKRAGSCNPQKWCSAEKTGRWRFGGSKLRAGGWTRDQSALSSCCKTSSQVRPRRCATETGAGAGFWHQKLAEIGGAPAYRFGSHDYDRRPGSVMWTGVLLPSPQGGIAGGCAFGWPPTWLSGCPGRWLWQLPASGCLRPVCHISMPSVVPSGSHRERRSCPLVRA